MLNVDLDRLKVVQEVFVREVDAKVGFPTYSPLVAIFEPQ
jgi:hypothetical protein